MSLLQWRPGAYLRDSGSLLAWLILRAVAQAATVLIVARWLGAEGYGTFVAAQAVMSLFVPIAGFGLAAVLLRDGARDQTELPNLLTRALWLWVVSATLSTGLAIVTVFLTLPSKIPLVALTLLALGEVAGSSLVEIIARVKQAQKQITRFGAMMAGLQIVRLAVLLPLVTFAASTPVIWMIAYGASSLIFAIVMTRQVLLTQHAKTRHCLRGRDLGFPVLLREGAPFAGGAIASRLQAEFNKPVLAHIGYAEAGVYNVAQRIVDLAMLPLTALQEALWPRVFAAGDPRGRLVQSGAAIVMLALVSGASLVLIAALIPWLIGDDYRDAQQTLVWLALLPAVQVLRNLGNAWLLNNGLSQVLLLVYAVAAGTSVLLTLLLVPHHGMAGAVWATYASEVGALGIQFATLYLAGRRVKRCHCESDKKP